MVLWNKTHYAPLNWPRVSAHLPRPQKTCSSSVSRHVKTLEEHFGYALFDREGPKISRTMYLGDSLYQLSARQADVIAQGVP
ncbi:helix-turn-helix domain-containing protein [Pseudomonas sessilinigenes]|uniref:helix-turn-helix domain-containing protein n=1 Tax=Pseudomonas sessilinigenes TaxID=658629 RepID=UPI003F5929C2